MVIRFCIVLSTALEMSRIVTNLTDQRVNVSDSTTLVCDVSGTPTPSVLWTKDNRTVIEGSGENYFFEIAKNDDKNVFKD